jgi:hypothetical protein
MNYPSYLYSVFISSLSKLDFHLIQAIEENGGTGISDIAIVQLCVVPPIAGNGFLARSSTRNSVRAAVISGLEGSKGLCSDQPS